MLCLAHATFLLPGEAGVTMYLWRADMLAGIVEADAKDKNIVRVADARLNPPGERVTVMFFCRYVW